MQQSKYDFNEEEYFFQTIKKHPYISTLVDSFHQDDCICLVFELEKGGTLQHLINRCPIPESLALTYFTQLCFAIEHMHQHRTMLKDIKPSNILLSDRNQTIAKIGGFGSTKKREGRYQAPEQDQGMQRGKADVWSMGIILHEMLTGGEHPFNQPDDPDYLKDLPNNEMRLHPSISQDCQEMIKSILVLDPARRPSIRQILKSELVQSYTTLITLKLTNGQEIGDQIREQEQAILTFHDNEDIEERKEEEKQQDSASSPFDSEPDIEAISDVTEEKIGTLKHFQIQNSIKQPFKEHTFKIEFLEQFIDAMNAPIGNFVPALNEFRQSPLAIRLKEKAFIPSLDQLNGHANIERTVNTVPFEGVVRPDQRNLLNGVYYGQLLDGKRDGYGLLYTIDRKKLAQVYCCQWIKGIPINGAWLGEDKEGQWIAYEGEFNDHFQSDGQGRFSKQNGFEYTGQFKSGDMSGFGKGQDKGGDEYEGEWRYGKNNGMGELRLKNGVILRGQFINDEFAQGTQTLKNGNIYEGQFINGKLHGIGKMVTSKKYRIGQWKYGVRQGEHKIYDKNGNHRFSEIYQDGEEIKLIELL
ncbi:hypothetical protein FGO68_gene5418 [Halteria grandinella]|uniref:Protein kinase domain-containing protein n=1 Tax=Halteria grandinella TaxID=5974 RepID=A0A8J8NTG1_HALGN|nr:hypothetical protein FGO68_gene5418 [Halteria grandinella]